MRADASEVLLWRQYSTGTFKSSLRSFNFDAAGADVFKTAELKILGFQAREKHESIFWPALFK